MRTISKNLRRYRDFPLMVGVGAVALGVNLAIMILVQRFRGEADLGIFSYLLSLYFVVGFLSEFGIPRYVENEIALSNNNRDIQSRVVANAFKATLFLSLFSALLILLSSAYNTAHTRVGERIAAYLIIGVTIPFRNINGLRLAFLEGSGSHDLAAKLKIRKYLLLIGTIFFLLVFKVPPSYLMLGFLLSELSLLVTSWKKTRLPYKLNFGFLITFWLMPIVLFILFSLINLFHFKKGYSAGEKVLGIKLM